MISKASAPPAPHSGQSLQARLQGPRPALSSTQPSQAMRLQLQPLYKKETALLKNKSSLVSIQVPRGGDSSTQPAENPERTAAIRDSAVLGGPGESTRQCQGPWGQLAGLTRGTTVEGRCTCSDGQGSHHPRTLGGVGGEGPQRPSRALQGSPSGQGAPSSLQTPHRTLAPGCAVPRLMRSRVRL